MNGALLIGEACPYCLMPLRIKVIIMFERELSVKLFDISSMGNIQDTDEGRSIYIKAIEEITFNYALRYPDIFKDVAINLKDTGIHCYEIEFTPPAFSRAISQAAALRVELDEMMWK